MKPPKVQFRPGMKFKYDGSVWEIIYMFLLNDEIGVWYHVLEERKEVSEQTLIIKALIGAPELKDNQKINYTTFRSYSDATEPLRNRFTLGDQITKTT
jgi:hypothetical protein